jgi:hypothetical protein
MPAGKPGAWALAGAAGGEKTTKGLGDLGGRRTPFARLASAAAREGILPAVRSREGAGERKGIGVGGAGDGITGMG